MQWPITRPLIVLTGLGLTLAAGPAGAQAPLRIGFFAPLTGFAAAGGASARYSTEIAVEEIDAARGITGRRVELVVSDDRHDSREAAAGASELIEKDQVVGVVSGSYSMPSRVSAPIFARAGVPMTVADAVHPDVTRAGPCVFRNGFLAQVEGAAGAESAVKVQKARRIAVLTVDNDFGRVAGAALAGLKDYNGITGKITHFVKGEATKPVHIQIVKDGKIRSLAVIDNPEVITPPVQ
jgi:branched-chain amino acid transport system substrate-binding protein